MIPGTASSTTTLTATTQALSTASIHCEGSLSGQDFTTTSEEFILLGMIVTVHFMHDTIKSIPR